MDRIYEICHYFKPVHWELLGDLQILDLDFSKIDQNIFNTLFRENSSRTAQLLAQISDTQLLSTKHVIGPKLKKKLSTHQQQLIDK